MINYYKIMYILNYIYFIDYISLDIFNWLYCIGYI